MYSYEEIEEYVREEHIQFIRLMFPDAVGRAKFVTVMPSELKRAFSDGISFDGSAVQGYGDSARSDRLLLPDPAAMAIVPWHPVQGKMVRFYCSVLDGDGRPDPNDTRALLRAATEQAAQMGVSCKIGTEFEFYIFQTDAAGQRTTVPFDRAGYMDIDPGDRCEGLRREICFTLMDMGIEPESAHHEEGPGQNEIDFHPADPLTAADNAMTFKSVVRTIAVRNGLYASFYPKPLPDESGSGLHINLSVRSEDGRDLLPAFLAGILEHIAEITVFLNPTEESYLRLGEKKAPGYICWGEQNRSALIRVPAASGDRRRLELRSPDPGMNPYLGFALLLHAGLDGVRRGLTPPEPIRENLYALDEAALSRLTPLPRDYAAALQLARDSLWLRGFLPEGLMP